MHARRILALMNLDSNPLSRFTLWDHEVATLPCQIWTKWWVLCEHDLGRVTYPLIHQPKTNWLLIWYTYTVYDSEFSRRCLVKVILWPVLAWLEGMSLQCICLSACCLKLSLYRCSFICVWNTVKLWRVKRHCMSVWEWVLQLIFEFYSGLNLWDVWERHPVVMKVLELELLAWKEPNCSLFLIKKFMLVWPAY
jgi:hypothetical protein